MEVGQEGADYKRAENDGNVLSLDWSGSPRVEMFVVKTHRTLHSKRVHFMVRKISHDKVGFF